MSTLADELLNDFEDSESEGEGVQRDGFFQDGASPSALDGQVNAPEGSMILDGDEEKVDDEEDTNGILTIDAVANVEDEEEAKAKVEKMQLGGVNDVRSVAGLMKTLEPVLEVCGFSFDLFSSISGLSLHLVSDLALTLLVASRKSHIIKICRQRNRQHSSDQSRTIRNIIF